MEMLKIGAFMKNLVTTWEKYYLQLILPVDTFAAGIHTAKTPCANSVLNSVFRRI